MTEQLGRRCALVLFAAMALALLTGLLAWGPVPLEAAAHVYADRRAWLGLPNAANVLASLPLVLAALWGLNATRACPWASEVRHAWLGFHACALAAGLFAALYHWHPAAGAYLWANGFASGAFAMLTAGMLAERADPRFGRPAALATVAAAVIVASAWVAWTGIDDLRPFLFIDLLPVLLIPAGALSLPGVYTRSTDWTAMLALYAGAKLADIADAEMLRATGWLSGHALMHLGLAGVTAWLAYRAASASAGALRSASMQRQTSLNTAG